MDDMNYRPSWQGFDNVDSCEPDVVIKLDAGKTVGLARNPFNFTPTG